MEAGRKWKNNFQILKEKQLSTVNSIFSAKYTLELNGK